MSINPYIQFAIQGAMVTLFIDNLSYAPSHINSNIQAHGSVSVRMYSPHPGLSSVHFFSSEK
jgi:hypothetical protein